MLERQPGPTVLCRDTWLSYCRDTELARLPTSVTSVAAVSSSGPGSEVSVSGAAASGSSRGSRV